MSDAAAPPLSQAVSPAVGKAANRRALKLGAIGMLGLIVLWEGVTRGFDLPPYVLPSVSKILESVFDQRMVLWVAARYTLLEAVSGFAIGSLVGVLLAALLSLLPTIRRGVLPIVTALNSVPVVAYAPLILLWAGIGPQSKIVMVSLAVGFTVFLHSLAGMDRVDRRTVDLMRSFGAHPAAIMWRLRIPAALPLIATGMRVSTVRSMIVAIVGEMLGAQGGLGWTIYQAVLQIDFVQVWAAIFVASAISLLFFGLVNTVEKRYVFWK